VIILGFSAVLGAGAVWTVEPGEPWAAWALGDSVCVHVGAGNNGSAFAGLNANTHWYNATLGIAMLAGRFLMIVPMLAVAGNLATKKIAPPSLGTFPVTTPLFTVLLTGVIVIVGALTFFPALSLGPILEHLLLHAGRVLARSSESASLKRAAKEEEARRMMMRQHIRELRRSLFDGAIVRAGVGGCAEEAESALMAKNPVMFVVEVGSVVTTVLLFGHGGHFGFNLQITLWLWFTVLFANFAEAMAEGRGKAQADALRKAKSETTAYKLRADGDVEEVPSSHAARGRQGARGCRADDSGRRRGD
jgi:hypothetical protein